MLVTSPPVAKSEPKRSCVFDPAAVSDGDENAQNAGSWRNVNAKKYVCVAFVDTATKDVAVTGAEMSVSALLAATLREDSTAPATWRNKFPSET